jgi:hypothetical protein
VQELSLQPTAAGLRTVGRHRSASPRHTNCPCDQATEERPRLRPRCRHRDSAHSAPDGVVCRRPRRAVMGPKTRDGYRHGRWPGSGRKRPSPNDAHPERFRGGRRSPEALRNLAAPRCLRRTPTGSKPEGFPPCHRTRDGMQSVAETPFDLRTTPRMLPPALS